MTAQVIPRGDGWLHEPKLDGYRFQIVAAWANGPEEGIRAMNGPEFNAELQCTPIRLGYDFTRRVGTIHIMRNDRCDMAGCTALFERIDRQVERITVFSGAARLLDYVRAAGGEWHAVG